MKKVLGAVILLLFLCLAGFAAAWYWPGAPLRRDHGSVASSSNLDAGAPQEAALGQFTPLAAPRPAPALSFEGRDGRRLKLADFHGHYVLVNLWATWCGPCVREMPSLDRLQARLGDRMSVVALSQDRGGAEVVEPFLARLGLRRLQVYLDPDNNAQQAFALRGLPTSILIDRDGRMLGSLEGAAEWDGQPLLGTLERYLKQGDNSGVIKTSATPKTR
jgi:thiol-disulfide isomerase/thioredoxin